MYNGRPSHLDLAPPLIAAEPIVPLGSQLSFGYEHTVTNVLQIAMYVCAICYRTLEGPLKLTSRFLLLLVVVLCCTTVSAFADTIPVTNPSFETVNPLNPLNQPCGTGCFFNSGPGSIPGWTLTGAGGLFQPGTAGFFTSPVPDGSIVAYDNGGTISQTLSATLSANTTYALSVDVGRRVDAGMTNFMIDLFAGSTLLDSLTVSNGTIAPGSFAPELLTFTTGANPLSGNLAIEFINPSPVQVNYDNVTLSATPVPEPSSLALLAAGLGVAFVALRRR